MRFTDEETHLSEVRTFALAASSGRAGPNPGWPTGLFHARRQRWTQPLSVYVPEQSAWLPQGPRNAASDSPLP